MTMTLKLAPHDGGTTPVTWIGGVTSVHRIERAHESDYLEKWATYFQGDGIRNFAASGPRGDTGDLLFTLLSVITERESFYVSAQSAWLLGPNGDTIERIAP